MICQLHAPTVLISEKLTRYPPKKRQGGPYSHSGPFGEGKISFSRVSTHDFSVSQRVVQPAYGLHYPGSLFFARHQQILKTCFLIRACRSNNFSTNLLRNFLQRTTVGYLRYFYHTLLPPSLIAASDRAKASDTERMASSFNLLKPTGYVMNQQALTFNNCTLFPH